MTVGTTLATTLTININNRVTFGQGIYQIRACDGWIKISFEKTDTANESHGQWHKSAGG